MNKYLLLSHSMKSALIFCQGPWGISWFIKGSAGRLSSYLIHGEHHFMESYIFVNAR